MFSIPQSTAFVAVFKAYLSDHVTEATGKTIAITISKAGGAFGNLNAGATNATEISSGWYKVTLDTTDTATLGIIALRGAASGIDDVGDRFYVVSASTGGLTNLDAAVSGRMATYTQPTGFLAATFPTSVASPTNITAGTITTVTNLTNAPTSGDLTSTMKTSVTTAATAATPTAAAVTGAVGSVTGAVGSISGITFPTHFSSMAIDVSGNVTFGNTSIATVTNLTNAPTAGDFTAAMKASLNAATPAATLSGDFTSTMKTSLNAATPAVTVSDKTGFSLASGGLAAVTTWSVAITGNITGNLSGSVGSVIGLTASNLDATISSRLAASGYTAPDNSTIEAAIAALPTTSTVMPADVKKVNGVTVNGDGNATPWGP